MTSVIIKRTNDNLNRYRSVEIFIDKKRVSTIGNNQEKELEITPGEHIIKPQIGNFGGHELSINLAEGEQKTLILSSTKNTGWFIYSGILILVFSALSAKVFQFSTLYYCILVGIQIAILVFYLTKGKNNYLQITEEPKV